MIRIIFTREFSVSQIFINTIGLSKKEIEISPNVSVYQKEDWILIFAPEKTIEDFLPILLENWNPDILYLPHFGRSIDLVHEIGDVILPNVFFTYNPSITENIADAENGDELMGSARFLHTYSEQKDYYVEDYGLSVGGIVVDSVPNDPHLNTALMTVYEGDIYTNTSLTESYTVAERDEVPTVILCGVIEGKINTHMNATPEQQVVRNMLTTIQLMEEME